MSTFAAVMTGQGTGAIATIQVFGEKARAIVKKIFQSSGTKTPKFNPGEILLGTINRGSEIIDQVTLGCESAEAIAINCHGNPLIVADIMQLLQQHGAKLLTAEQLLCKILSGQKQVNTIIIEAKLAQAKAKTIEGTKIIANQWHGLPAREYTAKMAVPRGLSKKAAEWIENIKAISLDQIKADAERILETSKPAKLIIYGCKVVIAGPPNSGKSTLLNCLCGRQKAIVTDIRGTTRDWVTGQCKIDSLFAELIDTAGLDEKLATPENTIEEQSQQRSIQILEEADLVLFVLDNNQPAGDIDEKLLGKIAGKKVLTVLNKSDLPVRLDSGKLPEILANTVQISAKFGMGIESLFEKIRQICGVIDFDLHSEVCFTDRQEKLLTQLTGVKSKEQAASTITELLNGQMSV